MDADSDMSHAVGRKRRRRRGRDRLSKLSDGALGHILSFLPATEAARAAALSRRWRHVFSAVHTLSFRETEPHLSMGYEWFKLCDYCSPGETNDVRAPRFVTGVCAALLGRARAAAAPLRALRVVFGFLGGDARNAVDGWLSYAAHHAGSGGLEIDLRLDGEPVCKRAYALLPAPGAGAEDGGGGETPCVMDGDPETPGWSDSDDDKASELDHDSDSDLGQSTAGESDCDSDAGPDPKEYVPSKSLFSCAVLRALRLGRCRLDLPSVVALPCLETLHLTRVTGPSGAVQRLVSSCPRLADLTLEDCSDLTDLCVLNDTRLRRLALRCCHNLTTVDVQAMDLRSFEYRGAVLDPRLVTLHDPRKMSLCTLDLCGEEPASTPELANLMRFLQMFTGVERLHLTSARLGCGVGRHVLSSSALQFPTFPALRSLELTGMLPDDDEAAIAAVTGILEQTPNLETLSLFFLPEPHPVVDERDYWSDDADEETIHAAHKLRYDRHATLVVPDVAIYCLRERTREINLVHYQGAMAQRMLTKFLLLNAPVVNKVCCEFARGPLPIQTRLKEEIKGWVLNKQSTNIMFL